MEETMIHLKRPRFQDGKLMLIAGLSERYTCETSSGIPGAVAGKLAYRAIDNYTGPGGPNG